MRTILFLASALLSILFLSGCYETRQEFTLNPDGSGKVNLEAIFYLENFSLVEDQTPDEKLKAAARNLLEQSKGVEAWKDVSFEILDDGRGYFKGTAYFRDVAELSFHNIGNTKIRLIEDKMNSRKFEIEFGQKAEKEVPEKKPSVVLSDEEITKELVKAKSQYTQELRPMMVALLANMKEIMLFHMPGAVQEGSNLRADVNGDIPFVFEGSKVIAAMDQLFEDEELLRREIKSGSDVVKDGPSSGDAFQEKVFGMSPPFRAVLSGPFQPLFNYHAEVVAAKTNYAAMTKALGIVASIPVIQVKPSPQGSGFKDLKVGGVRLVRFSDLEGGVRPFNYDAGYTLSLVGDLSGPVISIEGVEVLKAIADNDSDLLPEEVDDRKIRFPELSKDKSTVEFEVNLQLPEDEIKGIKELSGTMRYLVASGVREVDLEISEFEPDARGKEFSSTISAIGKSDWGQGQALSIKLELPKEAVKEFKIYDDTGAQVKSSGTSISWSGNQSTLTYISDQEFPARGRIVLSVYEQPQIFEIPFCVENISLLGQPLK